MDRPRRDSRQHNGITLRGLSQPTSATKSARSRHANEHRECLLSGTLQKSRFSAVRAVVDPSETAGCGDYRRKPAHDCRALDCGARLSLIVRYDEPTIANSWQKMSASATTTRRIPLATCYRSRMMAKNGSTPMGYRRLKGQWCSAPFFLHTSAQKFALYSSLRSGGLQPMPRKPQAVTRQF